MGEPQRLLGFGEDAVVRIFWRREIPDADADADAALVRRIQELVAFFLMHLALYLLTMKVAEAGQAAVLFV